MKISYLKVISGIRISHMSLFVFIIAMTFLSSCSTTNTEAPSASLPLPSVDSIAITAPDSNGYVVITGGEDSVPASSDVIMQVTDASTSLILPNQAVLFSSVCPTTVTVCPTLTTDNKCRTLSDTNGYFSTFLTASASSQIAITYFDSSSCEESEDLSTTVLSSGVAGTCASSSVNIDDTSWYITETASSSTSYCDGDILTYTLTFSQSGTDITAVISGTGTSIDGTEFTGTLCANAVNYNGSYPEDGGTTTVTSSVVKLASSSSASGTSIWSWTDGSLSCTGTSEVTAILE